MLFHRNMGPPKNLTSEQVITALVARHPQAKQKFGEVAHWLEVTPGVRVRATLTHLRWLFPLKQWGRDVSGEVMEMASKGFTLSECVTMLDAGTVNPERGTTAPRSKARRVAQYATF